MIKKKTRYILLSSAAGILFLIYILAAFRRGIWYYDQFLYHIHDNEWQKTIQSDTLHLTRETAEDRVLFHFQWGTETTDYTVYFDTHAASNESLKLYEGDTLIFTGYYYYGADPSTPLLVDSSGEWSTDITISAEYFHKDFVIPKQPSKVWLVSHALDGTSQFRGNLSMLVAAVLVLFILLLDIRFPKLFFYLSHGLAVYNPEPSDFYYSMKNVSRMLLGVLIGAMMFMTFL